MWCCTDLTPRMRALMALHIPLSHASSYCQGLIALKDPPVRAGGLEVVAAPLLRYANSVGADAGRLSARGVLVDGELRSAQAQGPAPVWFVFTGACLHMHKFQMPAGHMCRAPAHRSCTALHGQKTVQAGDRLHASYTTPHSPSMCMP